MDSMMGSLSMAVGGIAAISADGGRNRHYEYHAGVRDRAYQGNRHPESPWSKDQGCVNTVLTESAILSACGGIIGVILGVGTVSLGGFLLGFAVVIKPGVIVVAVSFSAVVGIFFGYILHPRQPRQTR